MPILKKPSFKQKREALGIRRNTTSGRMVKAKPSDPNLRKLRSDYLSNNKQINNLLKLEQKHLETLSKQFNENTADASEKSFRRSFKRANNYIDESFKLSEKYNSTVKEHNTSRQRERYLRLLEPRAKKLFEVSPELERLFEKKFYKNPFRPLGLETLVNNYLKYVKKHKIKSIKDLTREDIIKLSKPSNLDWKK